jgi:hypothetical protein
MSEETLQDRILALFQKAGEHGIHVKDLYAQLPGHLPQSIRGTVLSLVKKGRLVRESEGFYKVS